MKKIIHILTISIVLGFLLLTCVIFTKPASAMQFKGGDIITIDKDKEISEDLFVSASQVIIEGNINGDVYVASGQVDISGTIKGNLYVAGGMVDLSGDIQGDLIVFGGNITVGSKVTENVIVFGGQINFSGKSEIKKDMNVNGGSVAINGTVDGNVDASTGDLVVSGHIKGNLGSKGSNVTLNESAKIDGNFTYSAQQKAVIKDGAQIKGETKYTPIEEVQKAGEDKARDITGLIWGILFKIIKMALAGVVLVLLFKRHIERVRQYMQDKIWPSFGWGILVLFLSPLALVVILVTIIGIPLSLIGFALYFTMLYLSGILLSFCIGRYVFTKLSKKEVHDAWYVIIGVIIVVIVGAIPFIGWIIVGLGKLVALGALAVIMKQFICPPKVKEVKNEV